MPQNPPKIQHEAMINPTIWYANWMDEIDRMGFLFCLTIEISERKRKNGKFLYGTTTRSQNTNYYESNVIRCGWVYLSMYFVRIQTNRID